VESYLTVSETAEYLNTSERFVRRLIAERRIAFHHVGRHVRVALSDVEAWLATQRVEPHRAAHTRRASRRAS
jgi:excisionase family DNA binding protein